VEYCALHCSYGLSPTYATHVVRHKFSVGNFLQFESGEKRRLSCAIQHIVAVLSRCRHVAGNAATIASMKRTDLQQSAPANDAISYSGDRFPPDVISYAV